MTSEFSKRQQDSDFERVRSRVRAAVAGDPALRRRVDEDESEFIKMYDRLAQDTRRQRIAIHEVPYRAPEPARDSPPPEAARGAALLERARSGDLDDAAIYLDFLGNNQPPKEG